MPTSFFRSQKCQFLFLFTSMPFFCSHQRQLLLLVLVNANFFFFTSLPIMFWSYLCQFWSGLIDKFCLSLINLCKSGQFLFGLTDVDFFLELINAIFPEVAVSWDFLAFFNETNPPDKQAKMVLLKDLFSRRYSQANTSRSQKIKYAEIQNWLALRGVGLRSE